MRTSLLERKNLFDNIPQEMKEIDQWVCRKGKIPINPYTGKGAKSNDTDTWSDYDTAIQAYESNKYDGIGFELANGYVGIDLDKCIDENGIPSKEAMEIVVKMQSYTEISPSGTGYHIICKGKLPSRGRKKGFIEMYDKDRYFTMTGNAQGGLCEVFERQSEIEEIYNKYFGEEKEAFPQVTSTALASNHTVITDEAIINIILKSQKSGKLWSGNISDYGEDESRADLALCNFITNHTNDIAQIDRLFRQSGLMRKKWDRKTRNTTYGLITINKALKSKNLAQDQKNSDQQVIIPRNWEVKNDNSLWYLREKKKDGQVTDVISEFVSRNTPIITKRFDNVERTQILYELEWKDDGKQVTEIVTGSTISQKKDLLELSNKGLAVNDNNAKTLIDFINLFLLNNRLDRHYAVERIGNINGKIIHPLINTDIQIVALDDGEKQLLNGFLTKGTLESWTNEVFARVKNFPKALFFVLSSFASVVLKDLNINPFIVDLSGTTSQGKTTLLKVAASIWGTQDLISEWNATKVSIERKSSYLNSFPLFMDDTRKADDRILKDIIYQFSGGRSKGRGSVKGSKRDYTWCNIMLSTGEVSLNEYARTKGGAAARIIPLVDEPMKRDYENVMNLHEAMRENYGVIGTEFVRLWEKYKNDFIPQFKETRKFYADHSKGNDVLIRLSEYYASVVFVGRFLSYHLNLDIDFTSLENLFDEIAAENKDVDKPMQFLEDILLDLDNKRHSINYSYGNGEMKAIYTKTGDLYLMPAYVNEFLGVEAKQIRKEWMKRGITHSFIRMGKTSDTTSYKARDINGKNFNGIKVNKQILKELCYDFGDE